MCASMKYIVNIILTMVEKAKKMIAVDRATKQKQKPLVDKQPTKTVTPFLATIIKSPETLSIILEHTLTASMYLFKCQYSPSYPNS
jgi:hypothetical protein